MWEEAEQVYTRDVGVTVEDDHELIIELETPVPYFPDLLAFGPSSPVYRPIVEGWTVDEETNEAMLGSGWHSVERPSMSQRERIEISPSTGRAIQSHGWARAGKLVGNGPFQLDQWRYKRDLRLSRSPEFHNPDLAGFDTIEIRSIADPNTAVLAFLKGEVDWLTGVGAECRIDLLKQKADGSREDIHAIPGFGTDYYSFNCRPLLADGRKNPFADARVRRAFALSCNKQSIVDGITRLREPVASTFVPPNSIPGYESPSGLGYDPEQARAELAAAGWIDRDGDGQLENEAGEPFPDVELLYSTSSPRFGRISVELRDQWERELGIPVILIGQEIKFYKDDLRQGDYMIAGARWYGDYGDPTTFLDLFHSKDGNNVRGFNSPEVDGVLLAATLETDPDKRLRDLAELEARLFQQDLPMLPICQAIDVTMYDPESLTGITHHPRLTHYFWNLRKPGVQP
jgi:oligopeptide transport system substrate-binding protein